MNINNIIDFIEDAGYNVKLEETYKGKAISIGSNDASVRPVIYYENYNDDIMCDRDLANLFIEEAKKHMNTEFNTENLLNWDYAKNRLRLCARSSNTAKDNAIVRTKYDIDLYVRVMLEINGDTASTIVRDGILKEYGVSEEELFAAAYECTLKLYTVNSLSNVLGMDSNECANIIMISTEDNLYGASAIFNTDILNPISINMNFSDLIIIPSSIHEILVIPYTNDSSSLEYYINMVKCVNDECVANHERLSYNIFRYSLADNEVTILD